MSAVFAVAYPLAVYFGLSHFSVRKLSALLLCLVIPMLLVRFRNARREDWMAVLPVPAVTLSLIGLSALLQDRRFILALPVLISVALLVTFGSTLRGPVSMVERFARMQRPDLPDHHRPHCRQATKMWCVFFVANGGIAAVLAIGAPLEWWTLYTGLIAYVLMGLLFAGEYVVRRVRFRHDT